MITKHSIYFSFNGINSQDYGIINISTKSGLYEESFVASRKINEVKIRNKNRPYYQDTESEPLSFDVEFLFEDAWDDDKIREVARWLVQPYFCPLIFSESPEKVYWVILEGDSSVVHNGCKMGYVSLKFRAKDSYIYSPTYQSQTYTTSIEDIAESGTTTTNIKMTAHGIETGDYIMNLNRGNAIRQIVKVDNNNVTLAGITGQTTGDLILKYSNNTINIELTNSGDESILPSLEIFNIGNAPCKIKSLTDEGKELIFQDLSSGETVALDCDNEVIVTDKPETWRYNNCNLIFPKLLYGRNQIQLSGDFDVYFRYNFKFLT